MGVKDLKNYEREQAYLRQDQRKFILDVAERARAGSGKKINKNDVMRFALDLIMNRKPEHDTEIRTALGTMMLKEFTQEQPAVEQEEVSGPRVASISVNDILEKPLFAKINNEIDGFESDYVAIIPKLTNEQLKFCIENEFRKSGIRMLKAEAKLRGLEVE